MVGLDVEAAALARTTCLNMTQKGVMRRKGHCDVLHLGLGGRRGSGYRWFITPNQVKETRSISRVKWCLWVTRHVMKQGWDIQEATFRKEQDRCAKSDISCCL